MLGVWGLCHQWMQEQISGWWWGQSPLKIKEFVNYILLSCNFWAVLLSFDRSGITDCHYISRCGGNREFPQLETVAELHVISPLDLCASRSCDSHTELFSKTGERDTFVFITFIVDWWCLRDLHMSKVVTHFVYRGVCKVACSDLTQALCSPQGERAQSVSLLDDIQGSWGRLVFIGFSFCIC